MIDPIGGKLWATIKTNIKIYQFLCYDTHIKINEYILCFLLFDNEILLFTTDSSNFQLLHSNKMIYDYMDIESRNIVKWYFESSNL